LIAYAAYAFDAALLPGGIAQLAAYGPHEGAEKRSSVLGIGVQTVCDTDQFLKRNDLGLLFHQVFQQLELARREMDPLPSQPYLVALRVHTQLSGAQSLRRS
jgi:hypothetical protein